MKPSGYANRAAMDEIRFYLESMQGMDCSICDITPDLQNALSEVVSAHDRLVRANRESFVRMKAEARENNK